MAITTVISALPTPPSLDRPTTLDADTSAYLPAIGVATTQINAVASEMNALAAEVDANAIASDADAQAAAASAASALGAPGTNGTSTTSLAIGTGTKSFTTQTGKAWIAGQSFLIASTASPANQMVGRLDSYNSGTGAAVVEVATVSGSGTFASWTVGLASGATYPFATQAQAEAFTSSATLMSPLETGHAINAKRRLAMSAQSSGFTVTVADIWKQFDVTTSPTIAVSAAATFTAGDCFDVHNAGTGFPLVDFSGSETGDGQTTIYVAPSEIRRFTSDGVSSWTTKILKPYYLVLTASATINVGPGYASHDGFLWGGGGGGALNPSGDAAGGRGAAATPFSIPAATYGTGKAVVIGAGGAASASTTPTAGSNSTIGSGVILTAYGGPANVNNSSTATGVIAISAVYAADIYAANKGMYGASNGGTNGGGGVVAPVKSVTAGIGGQSNGGPLGALAYAGAAPGGGGGGFFGAGTPGAGARGELRQWGVVA